jgi:hypothetical protein
MELTPQEREKIYLEEKSKRAGSKSSNLGMIIVAASAIAALVGFLIIVEKPARKVKIEDLRKAYDGLSPEEEE